MYQFKGKDLNIKLYSLCAGNIWKNYTIDSVKKTGFKGCFFHVFPVDCIIIDTNGILNVYKHIMKIKWYKIK